MPAFYDHLSPDDVATLDGLSRLMLELRDSHAQLLSRYGVTAEAALLARIQSGELAEHPAYEDYLGARVIEATREQIRADLKRYMLDIGRT